MRISFKILFMKINSTNTKANNSKPLEFNFHKSLKKTPIKYGISKYFRVERYFTRPLASIIVRSVINTSITPNQLTYFSFFLGICSALFFLGGKHIYFIIAGILAQLSSIVDCSDGMLARTKDICTKYGAHLDIFLDRIIDFLIFSGIGIGYFIFSNDLKLFIICIFAIALYFLQVTLYYILNSLKQNKKTGESAEQRGLLFFAIFIFSISNLLKIFIYIAITAAIYVFLKKIVILVRLRKN